MLFFYIRHGDPTYRPNELTPLGHRQADAVAKRLALYGLDKIYSSDSNRAVQTARPTCELLKMEMAQLPFANEKLVAADFMQPYNDGKVWVCEHPEYRALFQSKEVVALGHKWYEHPKLAHLKEGWLRVARESERFFADLGYERINGTAAFKAVAPTDQRVAMFAHQGFGLSFFSWLMHIPYPQFCMQFDMCHSGMTVVEFKEVDGLCYPKILTLSSDSHLYREGLPLDYNHKLKF